MQDGPTKQEEHHYPNPKDPLVLLRAPFDLSNRVSADTQRIGDTVQPALRALQHFSLLSQIR